MVVATDVVSHKSSGDVLYKTLLGRVSSGFKSISKFVF